MLLFGCGLMSGNDDALFGPDAGSSIGGEPGTTSTPSTAGAPMGSTDTGAEPSGGNPDGDPLLDKDRDGIPAGSDCDDSDPKVGISAQRTCDGSCAPGTEQCVMGVWGACDAPADCACKPGDERQIKCGLCGTQRQHCDASGQWQQKDACSNEGECSPGAKEDRGACGQCGSASRTCLTNCQWDADVCSGEGSCSPSQVGSNSQGCGACGQEQTRTRACANDCAWGAWGSWGQCAATPSCTPNAVDDDARPCGNCDSGAQTRTRTCNAACAWTSWGAWGGCTGGGVCAAADPPQADTEMCGACNLGTHTRTRGCAPACDWNAWGAWSVCVGDPPSCL